MRLTPSTRPTRRRVRRSLCCAALRVAECVGQPDLRDGSRLCRRFLRQDSCGAASRSWRAPRDRPRARLGALRDTAVAAAARPGQGY
ncbi:hypothetical protein PF010_g7242 [Phytophthora fragariae]|uniref:Uncharacterized protein n=1 Tax=Phytophthora fragariae TaxID=53985 RepID=A0A6A3UE22_9STRA|nr:hypothetical protein PF003_g12787 [Phytophthora fragariae]KAE8940853.1 hypothetical protein PF009_g9344 [Phytophthora fragariae]KAE9118774.1 hypothetical protein PF007_g8806 [Phytophthora fragariae]KAE9121075.1 hypothetical protein PF010_g7242 [Phytophthora fragariae]KAE9149808.1 hypothetical protein PF006_g5744 [Phytophthora fragariae]